MAPSKSRKNELASNAKELEDAHSMNSQHEIAGTSAAMVKKKNRELREQAASEEAALILCKNCLLVLTCSPLLIYSVISGLARPRESKVQANKKKRTWTH